MNQVAAKRHQPHPPDSVEVQFRAHEFENVVGVVKQKALGVVCKDNKLAKHLFSFDVDGFSLALFRRIFAPFEVVGEDQVPAIVQGRGSRKQAINLPVIPPFAR